MSGCDIPSFYIYEPPKNDGADERLVRQVGKVTFPA